MILSALTISLCKERYQFVMLFNLSFSYLSEIDLIAEQFNQLVGGVIWIIRDGKQYITESLKIECQDTEETGKFIDEYIRVGLWCLTIFQFITWWSVLLMEETGVPRENYRPIASHRQTLSHNVISSMPHHEQDSNSRLYW